MRRNTAINQAAKVIAAAGYPVPCGHAIPAFCGGTKWETGTLSLLEKCWEA